MGNLELPRLNREYPTRRERGSASLPLPLRSVMYWASLQESTKVCSLAGHIPQVVGRQLQGTNQTLLPQDQIASLHQAILQWKYFLPPSLLKERGPSYTMPEE